MKEKTERKEKKKNGSAAGFILVGLVLAVGAYIALIAIEKNVLKNQDKTSILISTQAVPRGTMVTADNWNYYFKQEDTYASIVPEGAITDPTTLNEKYSAYNISANTVLSESMLIDGDEIKKDIDSPVLVSFMASTLDDNVAGVIRSGDYINIYSVTVTEKEGSSILSSAEKETNIDLIKENVYVQGVYTSGGLPITGLEEEPPVASVYTVYVDESEVQSFFRMVEESTIKVGLR